MKSIKHTSIALALTASLFITSCSNQMYSYRQKVKVNQEVAKAKPVEAVKEIEAKNNAKVEMAAPMLTATPAPKQVDPKMEPVLKDIQQMVPQHGSKAFATQIKNGIKSYNQQMKTIKRDIQKASGFQVDGVKWMIVGAVLTLIAWVLHFFISGGLISALYGIGGLIFIIGLIFFLIDYLK